MTLRVVLAMAFLIVCNANSWAAKLPRGDFGGKALSCLRVDGDMHLEGIIGIDLAMERHLELLLNALEMNSVLSKSNLAKLL